MKKLDSDFAPIEKKLSSLWEKYHEKIYPLFKEFIYVFQDYTIVQFPISLMSVKTDQTKETLINLAKRAFMSSINDYGSDPKAGRRLSYTFLKIIKKCEIEFDKFMLKHKKSKLKPETEKSALGKYAFPQDRTENTLLFEPNTKIEDALLRDINSHFNGYTKLSKESAKLIQTFLKSGKYPDMFKEPNCDKVYRGMYVSDDWIRKLLRPSKTPLTLRGKIDMNFSYIPRDNYAGSSWSTSKQYAKFWAENQRAENEIDVDNIVVLIANVSDNKQKFVIGKNGLYKLEVPSEYSNQDEAVGLGTIKVSGIEWKQ